MISYVVLLYILIGVVFMWYSGLYKERRFWIALGFSMLWLPLLVSHCTDAIILYFNAKKEEKE